MPRYDYLCPTHGTFEIQSSFDDYKPSHKCPTCKKVSWRDWAGIGSVPIHGGPTTSAFAKVRPENSGD